MAWEVRGWKCAFVAEIDPAACWVLHHRYGAGRPQFMPDPDEADISAQERNLRKNAIKAVAGIPELGRIPNYGDFTKIPASAGPIDVLVGGTPCQSFSVAGRRLGLDDPRGNLAIEFCLLARRVHAARVAWENVPGVLSSSGGSDFAAFLGLLVQCGYGWAYRVLDAQHVRTQRFRRAVPQRRRRVFVIGCVGNWRRAGAILFEPYSLLGDSAPRREAGKEPTRTIEIGPSGGNWSNVAPTLDAGCADGPVRNQISVAVVGGFQDGAVSGPVLTKWAKGSGGPAGDEMQNMVAVALSGHGEYKEGLGTLRAQSGDCGGGSEMLVAHTLRGEGFDASEDGTGKGTPIIPVCFDSKGTEVSNRTDGTSPALRAMAHSESHQNGGGHLAVAFQNRFRGDDGRGYNRAPPIMDGIAGTLETVKPWMVAFTIHGSNGTTSTATETEVASSIRTKPPGSIENSSTTVALMNWAVRRLTPRECERLQGFPDDHTLVPFGKKAMPDGQRYKMCGNSMPVNVIDWLAERIEMDLEANGSLVWVKAVQVQE
jgi:DNA (cytosine-5)-methyltransferase 1